jgi:putative nucleotidyltransferase with HDIG domain
MNRLMQLFAIKKFRNRIILVFLLSMTLVACLNSLLTGIFSYGQQFKELRSKLMMVARTAALGIDAQTVLSVPLRRSATNHPAFLALNSRMALIREGNPEIKFIYLLAPKAGTVLQFVADPDFREPAEEGDSSLPGDEYDAADFPEMLKGVREASADRKLVKDPWGVLISGYAPIRDSAGRGVAVLGIDMLANHVTELRNGVIIRSLAVLALSIACAFVLGLFIAIGIERPLRQIVDGTRRISDGDLRFKIEEGETEEINELARSFNKMTRALSDSRENLLNNFYRTVESMMRILEARDPYTRGHSQRVSRYATLTAERMGVPEAEAALLKEAALLHDIGKVGVPDGVLNKIEKLTQDEWELIRRHPSVGEEILSPFAQHKAILSIVRGHHERNDGKGYPDGKKGEDIGLLIAIITIADAFDAMTSSRAYRKAMSWEAAIAELNRSKGVQFEPEVVDVFVGLIRKGVITPSSAEEPPASQH